jgi:hypothetical protein
MAGQQAITTYSTQHLHQREVVLELHVQQALALEGAAVGSEFVRTQYSHVSELHEVLVAPGRNDLDSGKEQ